MCAASPASSTRPARYVAAWRVASVNREIQVGSWTPKSVPKAATSDSLRSRSVGSLLGPICRSVVTTRTVLSVLQPVQPVDADGVVADARSAAPR